LVFGFLMVRMRDFLFFLDFLVGVLWKRGGGKGAGRRIICYSYGYGYVHAHVHVHGYDLCRESCVYFVCGKFLMHVLGVRTFWWRE